MLSFKPGQRWYSTAEPDLGLGTILRAENRQVDIIFTGTGELKHYTQASAPLVRCLFTVGDQIGFNHDLYTIESVTVENDIACYRTKDQDFIEGALDAEQVFIPPSIRLLLNQNDQGYLFDLRKNALCADQLNQDDFEHFVIELLNYYGCQFTPQSTHAFLLDASGLTLEGFDDLKRDTHRCTFDPSDCHGLEKFTYLDRQHALYVAAKQDFLNNQKGNASFLMDDRLPTRSAVLETVFTDADNKASCFAVDAKLNLLTQFSANQQAIFRTKLSTLDLTPYKRSLAVILPAVMATTFKHSETLKAGKLQALRLVVGSEFALFGKGKR
ncbi:MAG: hypothetical protein KA902_06215 [Arenimonas sp.]|nr:hypothetical protein [Arenimonas sp.]